MLDHEHEGPKGGINGHFWEKREWADGGNALWYFPLAGEFRLQAPPSTTGGMLCEEMGLGKTVEVSFTELSIALYTE
jgi:SNF2-related domain